MSYQMILFGFARANTQIRVDRYSGRAAEASATASAVDAPRSPTLSLKTNATVPITLDAKYSNHGSVSSTHAASRTPASAPQVESGSPYIAPLTLSGSTSQIFGSSLNGSPMATTADGIRDLHLAGDAPRYFPGVVSRGQRRNSVRQGSMHESDKPRKDGLGRADDGVIDESADRMSKSG